MAVEKKINKRKDVGCCKKKDVEMDVWRDKDGQDTKWPDPKHSKGDGDVGKNEDEIAVVRLYKEKRWGLCRRKTDGDGGVGEVQASLRY